MWRRIRAERGLGGFPCRAYRSTVEHMGTRSGCVGAVRAAAAVLLGGMLVAAPVAAFAAEAPASASHGMAAALAHSGVIWASDDGTTGTSIAAVSHDGSTLARFSLGKVQPGRWEAMTSVRSGNKGPYLYVADIGAPDSGRAEVMVHRVAEPTALSDRTLKPTTYRLKYSDGAYHATALLADPRSGRLYVVTTDSASRTAGVYAAPDRLVASETHVLTRVADAPRDVVDGTFLPDGRLVLITASKLYVADDLTSVSAATALALPANQRGLSITVADSGSDAALVSREAAGRPFARVRLPARAADAPSQSDWRTAAVALFPGTGAGAWQSVRTGFGRWSFAAPAVLGVLLLGLGIPPRRFTSPA